MLESCIGISCRASLASEEPRFHSHCDPDPGGSASGRTRLSSRLLYGLLLRSLPVKDPAVLSVSALPAPRSTRPCECGSVSDAFATPPSAEVIHGYFCMVRTRVALDTDDGTPRMAPAGFVSGNGFEVLG